MVPLMEDQQYYMKLAMDEAMKGLGRTAPNPLVGAVLVKDGQVVGRGYHRQAGTPHAEINAIADAHGQAENATLYVTLEPCNHTGRTPPCTEAILRAGIRKVVIGMADLNPNVQGGGAGYLRHQGLDVALGVLEEQCRAMNRPFIKLSKTGMPWVIMKAGLSLDGKITFTAGHGTPLTGPHSQQAVHRLRNQVDAILIGAETALIDNPSLTTRLEQTPDARDPLRIILDTSLRLPVDAQLLVQQSQAQTWVFCGQEASREKEMLLTHAGAKVFRVPQGRDHRLDLIQVLTTLGKNMIMSVLVEGGARVHGAFYGQTLVDEMLLFYAPYIIGDGGTPLVQGLHYTDSQSVPELCNFSVQQMGRDVLFRALIRHKELH